MDTRPRLHYPPLPLSCVPRGSLIPGQTSYWSRTLFHALIWFTAFFTCHPAVPLTFQNDIFERIGIEAGLSNSTVTSIFQDSRGFLWFGTQEGLNRYDGYSFIVYKHDLQDSTSLGSNWILSILEDRSGLLWIGTADAGLDCFDRETGRFRHFRNRIGDPKSLSHNQVEAIIENRVGALWVGTIDGLNRLDRKTGTFIRYSHDPKNPLSLGGNDIGSLGEDSEGNIWIGNSTCINRYVPASDSFIRYSYENKNLFHTSSIVEGRVGCIWISSWGNGLWKFDRRTGKFTAYHNAPGNLKSLQCNYVGHLSIDSRGNLWIGTNEGLDLLRYGNSEFIHFISDPNDNKSISANGIWGLHVDRTGILWIGTLQGGINKLVVPRALFTHFHHDARNPNSLDNDKVTAFFESRDGEMWVGTQHGLNRFDRKTGEFTVLHHTPGNPNSLSSDFVNTLWEDSLGTIWIGTSKGGFCLYDRKTNTFRTYRGVPTDSTRLADDWVNTFLRDYQGKVWIGTYTGISIFDQETGRFSRFSPLAAYLTDQEATRSVTAILQDRDRNIWIGSYVGLFFYDRTRSKFLRYPSSPSDPETLSNDQVRTLFLDGKGRLWIGTALGLNRLDRVTGKFIRYTKREGLSNDVINGISEDDRGNIWISSNGVISRLEPETGKITNFDSNDGIPFSVFNERAFYRTRDGAFFVGGTEGFFTFHPDSLKSIGLGPPMAITSFKVFNREANIKGKPTSEIKRVVLSHRDMFFSFEFAALDYSAPSRNLYAYRMEGFDRDWVQAGNRRYASYTNLDPGKYVFRVKGANKDGVWSKRDASMEIIILPPYWGTWWFRFLAGLLLIGTTLGVHLLRMDSIRRQKKKLEELVSQRTRELMEKQTQLVDKQEQLARSEELYRGLVETSPDAILVMDMKGNIRMANPRASELLCGGIAADLRGCGLRDFLDTRELERFDSLLLELRNTGFLHNISLAIDKGEGLFLPVELGALLIPDPEDLRCIGFLRDISERLRAEEEHVEKERLRGVIETAGGASHELNQPLQVVIGYIEILLMDGGDASRTREYLEKVRHEAKRMGEITRKLMNITQYRTKQYIGNTRIIDLDRSTGDRHSTREDGGE